MSCFKQLLLNFEQTFEALNYLILGERLLSLVAVVTMLSGNKIVSVPVTFFKVS